MNHNARWNLYYKALLQYHCRFGDALVPSGHVEFLEGQQLNLGNWVSYMRTRYRQNILPPERISLLEQVSTWDWGPVRPGPKSRDVVIRRNVDILSKRSAGVSLAQIAKEYGLSRQRVHQIIKENAE